MSDNDQDKIKYLIYDENHKNETDTTCYNNVKEKFSELCIDIEKVLGFILIFIIHDIEGIRYLFIQILSNFLSHKHQDE